MARMALSGMRLPRTAPASRPAGIELPSDHYLRTEAFVRHHRNPASGAPSAATCDEDRRTLEGALRRGRRPSPEQACGIVSNVDDQQ